MRKIYPRAVYTVAASTSIWYTGLLDESAARGLIGELLFLGHIHCQSMVFYLRLKAGSAHLILLRFPLSRLFFEVKVNTLRRIDSS